MRDYKGTGLQKKKVEIIVGDCDPLSSKAFEPLGPISWASETERTDLRNFAEEVGFELLGPRENAKNWPGGVVRRALSAIRTIKDC